VIEPGLTGGCFTAWELAAMQNNVAAINDAKNLNIGRNL